MAADDGEFLRVTATYTDAERLGEDRCWNAADPGGQELVRGTWRRCLPTRTLEDGDRTPGRPEGGGGGRQDRWPIHRMGRPGDNVGAAVVATDTKPTAQPRTLTSCTS